LSLYGYTTKRPDRDGKFLMGVIGLIPAGLVSMIWPSGSGLHHPAAGVLVFSA
jgi:FtsH-binding integral membrane protein